MEEVENIVEEIRNNIEGTENVPFEVEERVKKLERKKKSEIVKSGYLDSHLNGGWVKVQANNMPIDPESAIEKMCIEGISNMVIKDMTQRGGNKSNLV